MTDITQIQDSPNENDFIVPAENAPKLTVDVIADPVNDDPADVVADVEKTPEEEAAAKAAAKESFRRRRAEREVIASAQEIAGLRAQVRQLAEQKQPAPVVKSENSPKRPSPADYDLGRWDAKYEDALIAYQDEREEWIIGQAEAKAFTATENLSAQSQAAQELHSLEQIGNSVAEKGVDKYSDFEEVVQDALEAMPPAPEALKELVKLPNAEDVFYHLAQHPDELDKITALTPMGQALEFGKISARLAAKASVAKTVTNAKPSPQQPRGATGKFTSDGDSNYEKLLKAANNPWN